MPKRWSTKNLEVLQKPTPQKTGIGVFEFTDDYSVFHYSKMPDQIPGKGEALCRMAAHTFKLVEQAGVPTHLQRFIPPNRMEVHLVRILDPQLGELSHGERNCLIPLQVIYRNMLPQGASVFRRLESGSVTLAQLGLSKTPRPDDLLERPLIEFTTKLEEIDRFVGYEEARDIAKLSITKFKEVQCLTLAINDVVTRHAEKVGLLHADGKVEFGITEEGRIVLVDTAGTPDENRFIYNGFHVTKQVMRDFYLVRGLEAKVQQWAHQKRPRSTWPQPEPLPPEYISSVADMYAALSDLWTGARALSTRSLDSIVEELGRMRERWVIRQ